MEMIEELAERLGTTVEQIEAVQRHESARQDFEQRCLEWEDAEAESARERMKHG